MGIPKKKSRKIVVAGRPFRWMLKGDSRIRGGTPVRLRFIAQEDESRPGRPLVMNLLSKRWKADFEVWGGGHRAAFTPKDAEVLIQAGLTQGWEPSKRGAAFTLNTTSDLSEFETCP